MAFVEGIAVSGEVVENLKDKRFTIVKQPIYENKKDLTTNEDVRILKLTIELAEQKGVILEYYPNKTSIKSLAALNSMDMDHWIGKSFEFRVNIQQAFGKEQKVLFVQAISKK